jgi:23S rRNA (guanosine2251-2'-O)-methyltransferase
MDGAPIQSTEFDRKRALILGSEGKGLSKKAQGKIDHLVSIEMKHAFDSLNVSAAAAILIHRMGYAVK